MNLIHNNIGDILMMRDELERETEHEKFLQKRI